MELEYSTEMYEIPPGTYVLHSPKPKRFPSRPKFGRTVQKPPLIMQPAHAKRIPIVGTVPRSPANAWREVIDGTPAAVA